MSSFLERRRKKDKQANWIFLLLAIIFITSGFYLGYVNYTAVELSKIDGCPVKGGARGTTAVLFDNTDKYAPVIEADLRANLYKIKESVARYQKLAIYVITEDANNIRPIIEICNPGSMEDESKFAFLYRTPKMVQKKWEKEFSNDVDNIIEILLKGGTSDWSPIFEMIQAVNISSLKHSNDDYRNENKLYIFSDFLHNSPEFSQYKDKSNFEDFKKNNKTYYEKVYSMLRDTYVKLFVVNRPQSESIESINSFWKDFFIATEAKNRIPDIEFMGK